MTRSRIRLFGGLALAAALAAACGSENPVAPPPAGRSSLLGAWSLESLTSTGQATLPAPAGVRFTATFEPDDKLGLRADCNVCGASYQAGAGTLAVGPMACTRAFCASAPFDSDFASLVSEAKTFTLDADRLTLRSSAGTVVLRR